VLTDHHWKIPKRGGQRHDTLVFDTNVRLGESLFAYEKDLITAKLLMFHALSERGTLNEVIPGATLVRDYLQFVRWRLWYGVESNSGVTATTIAKFFDDFRERGPRRLVPSYDRMLGFVQDVRSRRIELPVTYGAFGFVGGYVSPHVVATHLGFASAKAFDRESWIILLDLCSEYKRPLVESSKVVSLSAELGISRPHSITRLCQSLQPLKLLWNFRDLMGHDSIGVNPFAGERSPWGVAKAIATKPMGKTETIEPELMCSLIDAALRWVLDYSIEIKKAHKLILEEGAKGANPQAGRRLQSAIRRRKKELDQLTSWLPGKLHSEAYSHQQPVSGFKDGVPFESILYELLPAACLIVIGAFSARRIDEIMTLRSGCFVDLGGDGVLRSHSNKILKRTEDIPVPTSVGKAIDVLQWLSEIEDDDLPLFRYRPLPEQVVRPGDEPVKRTVGFNEYRALRRFAALVHNRLRTDGEIWKPLPHQFRRFFAVTYFYRYKFPHLSALSQFFRHSSPAMTAHYLTESVRGEFLEGMEHAKARQANDERLRLFKTEKESFFGERLRSAVLGKETMSGLGGNQIMKQVAHMVAEAKTMMRLLPDEPLPAKSLDSIITSIVSGRGLEPNGLGHSYCKCTEAQDDVRSAACVALAAEDGLKRSAPDPAFAADDVCSRCPHNVQLEENKSYWFQLRDDAALDCKLASGLVAVAAQGRSLMANAHIRNCWPHDWEAKYGNQSEKPR
tara:strand:- start:2881 stop:5079 length:2199 start_codon:yes stop_codon:yes gene_type:complete